MNEYGCGNVFHLLLGDVLEIVVSLSLQGLEEPSSNAARLEGQPAVIDQICLQVPVKTHLLLGEPLRTLGYGLRQVLHVPVCRSVDHLAGDTLED